MRTLYLRYLILAALLLCGLPAAYATHVRAGEITARRTSTTSLTYEITLTVYCDYENGRPATDNQGPVTFCFGDGSAVESVPLLTAGRPSQPRPGFEDVGNNTRRLIFRTVHTFNAPGTYKVSVGIENRNANTLNITSGQSDRYPFYVESVLTINAFLGLNSTPVMANPPVDFVACTGQRYIHNPNAFDADGDSLAYRVTQNKTTLQGESCSGFVIPSIVYPDQTPRCAGQNEARTGAATYTVNALTGDVVWDAPFCAGQYNIAFIVEEWRNGVKIGEITRDMQVVVRSCTNTRPVIEVPDDVCIEAGQRVQFNVRATDKDNNPLRLQATGSVFRQVLPPDVIQPEFATFAPSTQQPAPATGTFTWQTNCTHLRGVPYEVLFKVEDNPGSVQPRLVDSKLMRIRVVAPRPTGLRATPATNGRSFTLNWNAYPCPQTGAEFVIYRREGCGLANPDLCSPVPPPGFAAVGRVGIGQTTFTDTTGIRPGISYSYSILVRFPGTNQFGSFISAYSAEACVQEALNAFYLTHVSVDSTSATNGQITVRWTRPRRTAGSYEYRVFRATGLNGTAYSQVASIPTALAATAADTVFQDRSLNTQANAYRYRIELYSNGSRLDTTRSGSSVRLTATPGIRRVTLSWQAATPWNNQNQTHRIYRESRSRPGVFNRIADVQVQGPGTWQYTDDGTDRYPADGTASLTLSTDSSYCYRVETAGTYNDVRIHTGLLYNFSQRACASPTDSLRPCPPVLTLDSLNCATYLNGPCENPPYSNRLSWTDGTGSPAAPCDPRIAGYNIYYKRYADEGEFEKIDSTTARTFTHANLPTYAGCYYVTARNASGAESRPSNTACKDNCVSLMLPNVITPNGDNKNDVFRPMDCPRFVSSMQVIIYTRWGVKIYESAQGSEFSWDGRTQGGKDVAAGTYYYEVRVTYSRLNRADERRPQIIKGWVTVMR